MATETQTYWELEYRLCNKFDYKKYFFPKAKKWDTLQTFDLEQLLYLGSNSEATCVFCGGMEHIHQDGGGKNHWETVTREFPQHIDCREVVQSMDRGGVPLANSSIMV